MDQFQSQKSLVLKLMRALETGEYATAQRCLSPDYRWRAYHPLGELVGGESVISAFWQPLKSALTSLQRREDIFFAGFNDVDGGNSVWVVSMGNLMGLFDNPWLGIRPTNRMTFLRYCAFEKVEGDVVSEGAMFFDIPHLMCQAGQNPFPPATGAHFVQPGPMPHDGLLRDAQPLNAGQETLRVINSMISDLGQWKLGVPLEEELARSWSKNMIWWGPAGIGSSYTIERYAKQHSAPFRAGFEERSPTTHIARVAEGSYGGFFGWPNFTAVPVGGFMGMPGTGKPGEFRVMDIYRRDGSKLVENWVFIDLLHFWHMQGIDILKRAAET